MYAKNNTLGSILAFALRYMVPLAVTSGLCWLLFAHQDWHAMIGILRTECRWGWIAAALGLSVFSHIVRALRWRMQLTAIGVRAPLWVVVLSIFGTYAVNLVLPRLGEIWRTGYISRRQKAPFTDVFGTMVADRLADTITVGCITLVTFALARQDLMDYLAQGGQRFSAVVSMLSAPWIWSVLLSVIAVAVALIWRYPHSASVLWLGKVWHGLWHGFAAVLTMRGRGWWLALTLLLWGCYFVQFYLACQAFPVTARFADDCGIGAVMLCFVLSSLSMAVPSQGGIGPWQWAVKCGLMIYSAHVVGLTELYAITFANTVMGTQTLLLIALGIITFITIMVNRHFNEPASN